MIRNALIVKLVLNLWKLFELRSLMSPSTTWWMPTWFSLELWLWSLRVIHLSSPNCTTHFCPFRNGCTNGRRASRCCGEEVYSMSFKDPKGVAHITESVGHINISRSNLRISYAYDCYWYSTSHIIFCHPMSVVTCSPWLDPGRVTYTGTPLDGSAKISWPHDGCFQKNREIPQNGLSENNGKKP